MGYKELVPKKIYDVSDKRLIQAIERGYIDDFVSGYHTALTDIKPLLEYVEKLEKALDEIAKGNCYTETELIAIAKKARCGE